MQPERPTTVSRPSMLRAVRRHLAIVIVCLVTGVAVGWLVAGAQPATYTSVAQVLVNPTVGNPFAPAPTSVRQDELTSLETEAQVARSAEVMTAVAAKFPPLTQADVARGVEIIVPPNTQILEISYTAGDPVVAQQVTDAIANGYLTNRERRATEVNDERIERVETQTLGVVEDLRNATAAAQQGTTAQRQFQAELAAARRNELVSLRAQRTYLENSEAPAGSVISPASPATDTDKLTALLMLAGGTLTGLALGCLVATLLERFAGRVRSATEVEAIGLPVIACVPHRGWRPWESRTRAVESREATIRRMRAAILGLEEPPEIIAVAPAGTGRPDVAVSESVAESFAKAGHRVVLVRTDGPAATSGLEVEEPGLAEALLHERLNVLEMLQPSVEPLLSLLPWGISTQSRELLAADRLRAVLAPLVEDGHLVILQSPGIDSAEGEAVVGAADLGLVVVTVARTRTRAVEQVTARVRTRGTALAALVVDSRSSTRRGLHPTSGPYHEPVRDGSIARDAGARVER